MFINALHFLFQDCSRDGLSGNWAQLEDKLSQLNWDRLSEVHGHLYAQMILLLQIICSVSSLHANIILGDSSPFLENSRFSLPSLLAQDSLRTFTSNCLSLVDKVNGALTIGEDALQSLASDPAPITKIIHLFYQVLGASLLPNLSWGNGSHLASTLGAFTSTRICVMHPRNVPIRSCSTWTMLRDRFPNLLQQPQDLVNWIKTMDSFSPTVVLAPEEKHLFLQEIVLSYKGARPDKLREFGRSLIFQGLAYLKRPRTVNIITEPTAAKVIAKQLLSSVMPRVFYFADSVARSMLPVHLEILQLCQANYHHYTLWFSGLHSSRKTGGSGKLHMVMSELISTALQKLLLTAVDDPIIKHLTTQLVDEIVQSSSDGMLTKPIFSALCFATLTRLFMEHRLGICRIQGTLNKFLKSRNIDPVDGEALLQALGLNGDERKQLTTTTPVQPRPVMPAVTQAPFAGSQGWGHNQGYGYTQPMAGPSYASVVSATPYGYMQPPSMAPYAPQPLMAPPVQANVMPMTGQPSMPGQPHVSGGQPIMSAGPSTTTQPPGGQQPMVPYPGGQPQMPGSSGPIQAPQPLGAPQAAPVGAQGYPVSTGGYYQPPVSQPAPMVQSGSTPVAPIPTYQPPAPVPQQVPLSQAVNTVPQLPPVATTVAPSPVGFRPPQPVARQVTPVPMVAQPQVNGPDVVPVAPVTQQGFQPLTGQHHLRPMGPPDDSSTRPLTRSQVAQQPQPTGTLSGPNGMLPGVPVPNYNASRPGSRSSQAMDTDAVSPPDPTGLLDQGVQDLPPPVAEVTPEESQMLD